MFLEYTCLYSIICICCIVAPMKESGSVSPTVPPISPRKNYYEEENEL